MNILPAFQIQKHISSLFTAIKNLDIIKMPRVLNMNLRMMQFQIFSQRVIERRVPLRYHHQCFPIQIGYFQLFSAGEPMSHWDGHTFFIGSKLIKITPVKPLSGITDAYNKIKFLSYFFNDRQNAVVIILKRNNFYLILREWGAYLNNLIVSSLNVFCLFHCLLRISNQAFCIFINGLPTFCQHNPLICPEKKF